MDSLESVAWISGRFGRAIIKNAVGISVLDVGQREPRACTPDELSNFLTFARDLSEEKADAFPFSGVYEKLLYRWRRDRALLMVLSSLDPAHNNKFRKRAARLAIQLLKDEELRREISDHLSQIGLPEGADIDGSPNPEFFAGLFALELSGTSIFENVYANTLAAQVRLSGRMEESNQLNLTSLKNANPIEFRLAFVAISSVLYREAKKRRIPESDREDLIEDFWLKYFSWEQKDTRSSVAAGNVIGPPADLSQLIRQFRWLASAREEVSLRDRIPLDHLPMATKDEALGVNIVDTPERRAELTEGIRALRQTLDSFSPSETDLLDRLLDGLTYSQIMELPQYSSYSKSGLYSKIAAIRKKLRSILE